MTKGKIRTFLAIWWENILKMIPMNLLYSFMTVTLIPCGLASVGMANATMDLARQRYYFNISDYFAAMKKNGKQAFCAGLINLLITAVLVFAIWFYFSSSGLVAALELGLSLLTMIVFSFMKYYVWPQMILFQLPLRKIYKNAFLFAFLNFKNNLIIGFVSVVCYALAAAVLLYVPYAFAPFLFLLIIAGCCIFPGFKQLLVQYCVFPFIKKNMIDPYYAEHPDEDVEERKNMGI